LSMIRFRKRFRKSGRAALRGRRNPTIREDVMAIRPYAVICTIAGMVAAASPLAVRPAAAVEIAMACGGAGAELQMGREVADRWSARSGHTVRIVPMSTNVTERLALYQQIFSAHSAELDALLIDTIWQGMLAEHMTDMRPYLAGAESQFFQSIVQNNTVGGRLVSIPAYTEVGQLYYRRDLLEKYSRPVPRTWAELTETAAFIQAAERRAGNDRMWGYVWQGRASESLTCNGLEWIYSSGGGAIMDGEGDVTINNPRAAAALRLAQSWVGTISPPGITTYQEEEARGVFPTGNAVFMRNWSYAWALAQSADRPTR